MRKPIKKSCRTCTVRFETFDPADVRCSRCDERLVEWLDNKVEDPAVYRPRRNGLQNVKD